MIKFITVLLSMSMAFNACGQINNKSEQEPKQVIEHQKKTNHIIMNTSPESIIKSLIAAMSSKDAQKIRSLFDKNASQAYGNSPAKSGKAFFSWLESDIIEREGMVAHPEFKVDQNQVIVTGQYSSKGYTNKADFLFKVKDGKIVSWQMRY